MNTLTRLLNRVLTLGIFILPCLAFSQSEKKNSMGVSIMGLPEIVGANAIIVSGEFERFLNEKNSIAARVEYIGYAYNDKGSDYREKGDGSGGGIGFSYKHFFSSKPYEGFYLGPALELVVLNGTYTYTGYSSYEYGKSTSIAICPNFIAGYRFNFGNSFSVTPSVMLGYRAGIAIDTTGEFSGESGPLAAIGVKLSWRF